MSCARARSAFRAEGLARRSIRRSVLPCFLHTLHRPKVLDSGSSRGRNYSFLHDFCMQIPYGSFIVVSGIVLGFRGPLAAGVLLGLVGMAVLLCARASLKAWKLGRPSTPYTVMSTMATAYLTWVFGLKFKMMVVKANTWGPMLFTPAFLLFLLSVAITLFQIYNVWAGGNPPKMPKADK